MNSLGVRSVTSSRSSAPPSRSEVIAVTAWSFHAKPPETNTGVRNRILLIAMGVVGLILNRVAGAMTRKQADLTRPAQIDPMKRDG